GIDERLECGARLALSLRGPVERRLLEVATANHGEHLARVWIHRHPRCLQRIGVRGLFRALPLLDVSEAARDFGLGGLLHVEIDRRGNLQTSLISALLPEAL